MEKYVELYGINEKSKEEEAGEHDTNTELKEQKMKLDEELRKL